MTKVNWHNLLFGVFIHYLMF